MAKAGKRYPLLLYTRMMDRWWPPVFLIGLVMLGLGWWLYGDLYRRLTAPWQWLGLAGTGGLCVFAAFLMLVLRKSSYVRLYGDYVLVATPLLRMKVSYRRILRTSTASMGMLFPPRKMSFLQRDTIAPLLKFTAVVVDLKSLPMPRPALRLFLSPFFFKDQTPHIVLLVQNWMAFSAELESKRVSGDAPVTIGRKSQVSILSQLPKR